MPTDQSERWHWSEGSGPHHQSAVYSEATGQTIAVIYDDEGALKARRVAAVPELITSLDLLLIECDAVLEGAGGAVEKLRARAQEARAVLREAVPEQACAAAS